MKRVLIGEVVKPQGIKGELKVYPLTADIKRFKKLKQVFLENQEDARVFAVNNARWDSRGMVYLRLEGIDSTEAAQQYRGFLVKINHAEVPPLQEGWYYFELEGMQVYDKGIYLGILTKIQETGANDVYIVQGEKGEICVPALKSVVKEVDVTAKRMDVELPPGLLD